MFNKFENIFKHIHLFSQALKNIFCPPYIAIQENAFTSGIL